MFRFSEYGGSKAKNGKIPIIRKMTPLDGKYEIDMNMLSIIKAPNE